MSTKIAPGSTIVVLGGAGYVGSGICNQLLVQGFKVKATTRTFSKLEEMKTKADKAFGPGSLEIVEIKDLSVKGALDDALNDPKVAGVINVASDVSFSNDLEAVVQGVTSLTKEVLSAVKAAADRGHIKSFVSTSSRIAASFPNKSPSELTLKSGWYEEAYSLAQKEEGTGKALFVYAASKVAGERAIWDFYEKQKPKFRCNTVLPDLVLGKIYNPAPGNYSTGSGFSEFATGGRPGLFDGILSVGGWFVHIDDVAKLHTIALLEESLDGERIWAASAPILASDVQKILKEISPSYKERDLSGFPGPNDAVIDNKKSDELLQKEYGSGFQDLKSAIQSNLL